MIAVAQDPAEVVSREPVLGSDYRVEDAAKSKALVRRDSPQRTPWALRRQVPPRVEPGWGKTFMSRAESECGSIDGSSCRILQPRKRCLLDDEVVKRQTA